MKKRTLLIATTNSGKAKEIMSSLADLPFHCISVADLDRIPEEPEEYGHTLEENALIKARYYAEKTGHMSLADDSGFFIEAQGGWPGVKSARVAKTEDERCELVIEKLKNETNRHAQFRGVMTMYDPVHSVTFLAEGRIDLEVLETMPKKRKHGHGYDPILLVPEHGKTLDEMTVIEKNAISHRGKALITMKRYLQNQYRGKHFVVPIALIVKDGKILMNKRNDPHNQKVHGIMEFPGGGVEMGETVRDSVRKECKEETGYDVKVLAPLSEAYVKTFEYDSGDCQFYIMPYLCKIIGGELNPNDEEVLESHWMTYDEALAAKKFPGDNEMLTANRQRFEHLVKEHNL